MPDNIEATARATIGQLARIGKKLARDAARQLRAEQNQPRRNTPKSDRERHDVSKPPPLGPKGLGHPPRPRKKKR